MNYHKLLQNDDTYVPLPIFADRDRLLDCDYQFPPYAIPSSNSSDAKIDFDLAIEFLCQYNQSSNTFSCYRAEIERFLHWSWHVRKSSVVNHSDTDISCYIEFFKNPPANWIGTKVTCRFKNNNGSIIPNPAWRPFVAKLPKAQIAEQHTQLKLAAVANGDKRNVPKPRPDPSDYSPSASTVAASLRVLSSFYEFMFLKKVIDRNCVKHFPRKKKFISTNRNNKNNKAISNEQWEYIIETAEIMAEENRVRYERTLFILSLLYFMHLRISDIVHDNRSQPKMGDFHKDEEGNWFLSVVEDREQIRLIAANDTMLKFLVRYRRSLNLSKYPEKNENTPLLTIVRGKMKGIHPVRSTRTIRSSIQKCFDRAYDRMIHDNNIDLNEAVAFQSATVGWLRYRVEKNNTIDSISTSPDKSPSNYLLELKAIREGNIENVVLRDSIDLYRHIEGTKTTTLESLPKTECIYLYQIDMIFRAAIEIIGSSNKVKAWFNKKNTTLGNATPMSLLDTAPGIELVKQSLYLIRNHTSS